MNKLRESREKIGLRQLDASIALNITQGAISQWETGDSFPRAELLPKIAGLYKCSIDELLGNLNSENERIKTVGNCNV
jgi:transcriptional regulator with XRE-family HTH domain